MINDRGKELSAKTLIFVALDFVMNDDNTVTFQGYRIL